MNFQADQILQHLVTELLKEPFAQRQRFQEKDLVTVCHEIESAYSSLEANTTSYENSRDLLCLLLCHLELLGQTDIPTIKLRELGGAKPIEALNSPFLTAAQMLRELKTSTTSIPDTQQLDRLIGLHLCLELEAQTNKILKPRFFLPLNDLAMSVRDLGLNDALADLLMGLAIKRNEASVSELQLSDSWLDELERDFEAAIEYLNEYFQTGPEQEKAA